MSTPMDGLEIGTVIPSRSPQFATKMRKKAKDLAKQSEQLFMELGRILFIVWDTPGDGTNTGQPLYEKWGYNTFADYAEQELEIDRRRAQRLRRIWWVIEVKCAGIEYDLKRDLISLGSTKLRELIKVIDANNAGEWYERVKNLTVSKTRELVQEVYEGSGEQDSQEEERKDGIPRNEIFSLYPAQKDNLDMAMEAVKVLANNPKAKKGHCLDLICMDFVATNDVKARDNNESRSKYLRKLEDNLGVRIIAVNDQGKICHGMEVLEAMANASE